MTGLATPSTWATDSEALGGLDVHHATIDRGVDGLGAHPTDGVLGHQVGPDGLWGTTLEEFTSDTVAQSSWHSETTGPGSPPVSLGPSIRRCRPVPSPSSAGGHLTSDGGRMTTHPAANHRPRGEVIFGQRKTDLFALKQRQRRAWHGGVSIGRCRSTAPVIMTGTVHRPMELTESPVTLECFAGFYLLIPCTRSRCSFAARGKLAVPSQTASAHPHSRRNPELG